MAQAELRRRWISGDYSPQFDQELPLTNIDLRGLMNIGLDYPVGDLNWNQAQVADVDVSFGAGSINGYGTQLTNFTANGFKFDRASSFYRCVIKQSVFDKSKVNGSFEDCELTNCSFSESTLKGGHHEYGFRSCKFQECDFSRIKWKNTYFRNCAFNNCVFLNAELTDALIICCEFNGSETVPFQLHGECDVKPKSHYI